MKYSSHMDLADFNFQPFVGQSIRDPLQWSHDAPVETMVLSTHDAEELNPDEELTQTRWPATSTSHHQLPRSPQHESEGSSDTVISRYRP